MKKTKIFLLALFLFTSPFVMGDPAPGLFSQLTVTQPPYDYINPDPQGNIVVNGAPDRLAVITLNVSQSSPSLYVTTPPATLRFNLNGLRRWGVRKLQDAESGNNTGSSFQIESFDDAGNHFQAPITIARADGAVTLSGALISTRVCASGYTRIGPNFCQSDNGGVQVFDSNVSCTQTIALTGVSTAKAVMATVSLGATANNALGLRKVTLQVFDNTCATVIDSSRIAAYEFNPTVVGTNITQATDTRVIRSNASGQFYAKAINEGSGIGFEARYVVVGYFD